MEGLLLLDKPSGWTSFDVVNYVRKLVAQAEGKRPKQVKVGHTGTLDPLATGLLVLVLGSYTKRAPELTKLDKTYEVTMKLGERSTTGDEEGEKSSVSEVRPSQAAVEQALQAFSGELLQTPPAYSAIKVNGQRAYALARAGKPVALEPRPVIIYSNELLDYTYPLVRFRSEVSSGTYIRTLVEDLGTKLATGAYMSDLRRLQVGNFDIQDSQQVANLSAETLPKFLKTMLH